MPICSTCWSVAHALCCCRRPSEPHLSVVALLRRPARLELLRSACRPCAWHVVSHLRRDWAVPALSGELQCSASLSLRFVILSLYCPPAAPRGLADSSARRAA